MQPASSSTASPPRLSSSRLSSRLASRLAALVGLAVLPFATGCASAVWHPRVDSVSGEYRNVEALSARAEDAAEGSADDVKAIVLELPDGITVEGDVLRVDAARYEVLGKVQAEPAGEFFYPYRETWRRPFCYPQRVLVMATLFVWMAVPTSWPCFVASGSVDDRRDRIVEAMKRSTRAMGGNVVLVGGFGGTITLARSGSSAAVVSTLEATQGVGWARRWEGRGRPGSVPGAGTEAPPTPPAGSDTGEL